MRIKFLYPLVFLLSVSPLIPESLSLYKYNEKYGLINEERKIREENKFTSFIESDDYLICCLRNVSPQFHAYNKNGNKEIDFDAIAVKLVTENIILISDFHDSYYYDLKKKRKLRMMHCMPARYKSFLHTTQKILKSEIPTEA